MKQAHARLIVTPSVATSEHDVPMAASLADFTGDYAFYADESGTFLDFERLQLSADGTYTARVEATLVNPGVRSFGAPCMLPEDGVWTAYRVSGQTRIRIRPTTSAARVYVASLEDGKLVLSRRGAMTKLLEDVVTVRPSDIQPTAAVAEEAPDAELRSA